VIADNAPSVQPKVVANAFASAIVRSGEERVDVLLFVDQITINKGMSQPATYKNQVTVTMQKVGEDWLIDNVVTSPAAQ
jgi:Mce-associated membrane protein